ncbi:hypothetical protein EC957_002539 [Mortierella hygrophila]|uniref:VPS37 C-terminal domain-containing protein n=1 Tax=Mortierella hygrophila TaxID=979708 RepID=A0A9P6F4X6_9FUNG|nr:hypothetical protein EC957_002539 [Mortierella hygrophila]
MDIRRKRQIDSLLSELPTVRPLPNDNSRFQLQLYLASSPGSPHPSPATPHLSRTASTPNTNSSRPSSQDGNGNTFSITTPSSSSPVTAAAAVAGSNNTVTLTVYLPPAFPEEEPRITLQPTVRHLWVDGTVTPCTVIGHERLMPGGWSTHAHLGRIVKEIVTNIQRTGVLVDDSNDVNGGASNQYHMYSSNNTNNNGISNNNQQGNFDTNKVAFDEYSRKPPPPIPGARSKSLGLTNNSNSSSVVTFINTNGSQYDNGGSNNNNNNNNHINNAMHINNNNNGNNKMNAKTNSAAGDMSSSSSSSHTQSRPVLSNSYSSTLAPEARIIMELTPEKVEELLESQIAFDHFVDHLDIVINSRTLKREWWLGNDNVSRRNLALEAEMLELQNSTAEGHKVANQLQKSLEEKLQQQQDALWRFRPETLQSKLRSAASESEELSESIAQSFLEGKLDQEGFIRQYRDLRKVYHLRTMKHERMGPILRDHASSNTENSSNNNNGSGSDVLGSSIVGNGGGGSSSSIGGASGPGGTGDESWVMLSH